MEQNQLPGPKQDKIKPVLAGACKKPCNEEDIDASAQKQVQVANSNDRQLKTQPQCIEELSQAK